MTFVNYEFAEYLHQQYGHLKQHKDIKERYLAVCSKGSIPQKTPKRKDSSFFYEDKFYSLAQLEELSGIPRQTIHYRINKMGWSVKDAVETSPKGKSLKKIGNESQNIDNLLT